MTMLAVFADDFTGALDSGVQFTSAGFATDVLLWTAYAALTEIQAADLSEVIVIDTESRHLESTEAFSRLLQLTKLAQTRETLYFYKKTDSTLRGQIGAEMKAMMLGLRQRQIHFIPAYPKMNRTTINGIQYVDGIQLAQTPFADDPLNPVTSSFIPELLAAQGLDCVKLMTLLAVSETNRVDSQDYKVHLYNASSQDELEAISQHLKKNQSLRLTAGCAGFAEFLAKRLREMLLQNKHQSTQNNVHACKKEHESEIKSLDSKDQASTTAILRQTPGRSGPVLLLCGSANQASLRQLQIFAGESSETKFHVLSRKEKHPEYWSTPAGRRLLSEIKHSLSRQGLFVIQSVRKREDLDESVKAEDTAASFGTIAAAATQLVPDLSLIVFGGDTVYALMSVMRGSALRPLEEISPGVVASCLQVSNTNRLMVTKAGGLGDDNVIKNILSYIKQQAE